MTHALLSASGAHRWLSCTPSARLEAELPDTAGTAAREGTLAHQLGELCILRELKILSKYNFDKEVAEIEKDPLYKPEMRGYCQDYADYVIGLYNKARAADPKAEIFLEERLDFSHLVPEGFGTGDCCIVYNHRLVFVDLKYGKGVPVSATDNPQLSLYGLGALERFDFIYGIDFVELHIFQPRLDNFDTYILTAGALRDWGEYVVRPKAQLAYKGQGEFVPGEKQCMFCRAKATCKALADHCTEDLALAYFKDAAMLTDEELAGHLLKFSLIEKWMKAVKDHALFQAVHNGKQWPGMKLVEGRSVRKYINEKLIAEKLLAEGWVIGQIYQPQKLIGLTEMESLVGKKNVKELLGELIVKPAGKPALVAEDDKRPAYNSLDAALEAFKDVEADTDEV
jgi:hypothetical protein